ncbi:MAG: MFS transporter [Gemmatimonadota bacterium]|jgi:predicted MFS family arabinose efflux permease|nr:MAG: MFS transporter [Gemmatimonadota bacterium]
MQFLFAPLWGRLSDRYGRRPLLIVGLVGSAGSYLVFAFAGTVEVLLLSRIVGGLTGATIPVAQAYVADSSPRESRARAMGLIGAAFGIGFIIGPALGGFMSRWGYALPGVFASGLSLLAALVAVAFLPESLPAQQRRRLAAPAAGAKAAGAQVRALARTLGDARFRGPIGATLLANTGFAAYTTIFPLFLDEPIGMTATEAGAFFALSGLVSVTTQGGIVGRVVDRIGEKHTALMGLVAVFGAFLILPSWPQTRGILLSLSFLGLGWGLFNPALLGILSGRADETDQGSVLGVNQSASALARVLGPLAGGWAFGALGYALSFQLSALLLAAAALWLSTLAGLPTPGAPSEATDR